MKKPILLLFLIFASLQYSFSQEQIGQIIMGEDTSYAGFQTAISDDGNRAFVSMPFAFGTGIVRAYEWDGINWIQLGGDMDGGINSIGFGFAMTAAGNGNRVAVAFLEGQTTADVFIKIFEWDNGHWIQLGNDISNFSNGSYVGSISMSDDGERLAIGTPRSNNGSGGAVVMEWNGVSWNQLGSSIDGEPEDIELGSSIALSGNGNTVVMSCPINTQYGAGLIKTYSWNGTGWVLKGNVIQGVGTTYSNYRVAISESGNRLTYGVSRPDGVSEVKMLAFEFNGMDWIQLGSEITYSSDDALYGISVSMTDDGQFIAYGRTIEAFSSPTVQGSASIYYWDDSDWIQVGNDISDAEQYDGRVDVTVHLASDTRRIIVGSYGWIQPANQVDGSAAIYEYPDPCNWYVQAGGEIPGTGIGDESGISVDYSPDGNYMVVGSWLSDINGSNSGRADIYERQGSTWVPRGGPLAGENAGDRMGRSVAISDNGLYMVTGAYFNDGGGQNSGHARVYKWNGNTYSPFGPDIDGSANFEYSGYDVSISATGKFIAIGSPYTDHGGNNTGSVAIYRVGATSHVQVGSTIHGESAYDYSGRTVELSKDGQTVAIAAPYNDGGGSNAGQVRVFHLSRGNWMQLGRDIDGDAAGDYFGSSLSFSEDASTLAVGAYGSDANGSFSGHASVYDFQRTTWVQRGTDINGDAALDYMGISVSLTASGNRLAASAQYADDNGSGSGEVKIMDWDGSSWTQVNNSILGGSAGDYAGTSIALSGDGTTIAVGARRNDSNGSNSGHVRVFRTCSSNNARLAFYNPEPAIEEEEHIKRIPSVSLYPNPASDQIHIRGLGEVIDQIEIFSAGGQLIHSERQAMPVVDVTALQPGTYFIRIHSSSEIITKPILKF